MMRHPHRRPRVVLSILAALGLLLCRTDAAAGGPGRAPAPAREMAQAARRAYFNGRSAQGEHRFEVFRRFDPTRAQPEGSQVTAVAGRSPLGKPSLVAGTGLTGKIVQVNSLSHVRDPFRANGRRAPGREHRVAVEVTERLDRVDRMIHRFEGGRRGSLRYLGAELFTSRLNRRGNKEISTYRPVGDKRARRIDVYNYDTKTRVSYRRGEKIVTAADGSKTIYRKRERGTAVQQFDNNGNKTASEFRYHNGTVRHYELRGE